MTSIAELHDQHHQALDTAGRVVAAVGPEDLSRPTPCAAWDLRALLGHMIGQNHGFAAAIAAGDAAAEAYRPRPPDGDGLAARWQESVDALAAAVAAAPGDRQVRLVEVRRDRLPFATVLEFHLVDTVVHTWDVARALGRDHRPSAVLAAATARIASAVPDGESRRRAGAPFAPALPSPSDDDWATALALLGRPLAWSRPA